MNDKIILNDLKEIELEDGNILHALKKTDLNFAGFGEAYFSIIKFNSIKAWKLHTKMIMNLIVPQGEIKFVFFDGLNFVDIILSRHNYKRLTIHPNIWFGFMGLDPNGSMLLNIANIQHDPSEVLRKSIDEFDYKWI